MRCRVRLPSPAIVIALIALVVAMSGTAIAAVDFARNAGAVDGISAVRDGATLRQSAGRLVATAAAGPGVGRLSAKYVDGVMRGGAMSLAKYIKTVDQSPGAATALLIVPGIGRMDAQCADADPTPGTQTTRTSITFTASAAPGVNVSRLLGRDIENQDRPAVFTALKGRPVSILPNADGLFQVIMQAQHRSVLIVGASRRDASPGPRAACLIWGTAFRVG